MLYANNVFVMEDASFKDLRKKDLDIQKANFMKEIEMWSNAGGTVLEAIKHGKAPASDDAAKGAKDGAQIARLAASVASFGVPFDLGYYFNTKGMPGEKPYGEKEMWEEFLSVQDRNLGPKHNYAPGPSSDEWDSKFFVQPGERRYTNPVPITKEDLEYRRGGEKGFIDKYILGESPGLIDGLFGLFSSRPADESEWSEKSAFRPRSERERKKT